MRFAHALLACGISAMAVVGASSAVAQDNVSGPTVILDRYELQVGDQVLVTAYGFSARVVTISVCGNAARRGSPDCNMAASDGVPINLETGAAGAEMPVAEPPMPCPCLIRVSSPDNREVAVAEITLIGHPSAPVVGSFDAADSIDVSVVANQAPAGALDTLQASLGGPVDYVVVVTVRNRSAEMIDGLRLSGVGRRGDDDVTILELDDPGTVGPRLAWQQSVSASVPAPSWGDVRWEVSVTGAGPTLGASTTTSNMPWLLWVLGIVLVVDVVVLVTRLVIRRLRAERDEEPEPGDDATSDIDEGVLVGAAS
jgi:hypothetical protein